MGRIGILPGDLDSFIERLRTCKNLVVDGLLTHLAAADTSQASADDFTVKQINTISRACPHASGTRGSHPRICIWLTVRQSYATWNLVSTLSGPALCSMASAHRSSSAIDLKPVMALKTKIAALKKVPAGSSISYRRTFITNRESLIATLPIGYADGYSRQFSNRAAVLIRGRRASVAGVVCMDMVMIDVTDVADVQINDEVSSSRQPREMKPLMHVSLLKLPVLSLMRCSAA